MRVMNKNKSLFESFKDNLNEASVDETWCQEQAEYYFNQDCQDSGDLDTADYSFINEYTDNKSEVERVESLIHDAWKIIKDHIYYYDYKKYIELSDNHTLWNIENDKFPSDDYAADEYNTQVDAAIEAFKDETGEDLLLLGRSGRHVCVELNYQNALKYSELVDKQQELEKSVIDGMNSWEPENESTEVKNESAVEDGVDPEGGVEPLEEQDQTVRVVTSQQDERDYTITDITELNKIADGDVQPPIDITGLLNEVDARLNESIGENWGVINYQSTRYNSETGNSNALFELCIQDKTYLMSMLLEENGSLLKVNNTKGQTVFKRKTNDARSLAESYIRQFIPMNEAEELDKTECKEEPLKDRLEKAIACSEDLSNLYTILKFMIDSQNDVKDDGQYFNMLQTKIYSFVAELRSEVQPCMPTEKDEQSIDNFDDMVEALFGKDFVKVAEEEDVVPTVKGTETLKEDVAVEEPAEETPEEPVSDETPGDAETPKQGLGTGYASFVRKPASLEDLDNKSKYFTDGDSSYVIVSKEKLSKEEFDKLTDALQAPNEYCKAFEPVDTDNYAFNVIEFSCDEVGYKLLVDPSGYDYCRYVAKVGGNE